MLLEFLEPILNSLDMDGRLANEGFDLSVISMLQADN
jgi:hypothetical protein